MRSVNVAFFAMPREVTLQDLAEQLRQGHPIALSIQQA
jgi:hypothetical protein